jgi:uncharacterized protein (DUF305 family)
MHLAAAAVVAALPILAQAQHHGAGHGTMSGSDQAYMEAHQKMMGAMQAQPTGNSDRDFATMMIPHHQGAIDMARVQLQHGKDPELLRLAQKIIDDQEREIAQLRAWQQKSR